MRTSAHAAAFFVVYIFLFHPLSAAHHQKETAKVFRPPFFKKAVETGQNPLKFFSGGDAYGIFDCNRLDSHCSNRLHNKHKK